MTFTTNSRGWHAVLLTGFVVLLTAVALWVRNYTPIDETRYVSVAWEMWLRGDWLVPFKNGEVYAHKPPLLFWLYQLGWSVFGVNDIWPRLVSPLSALACLWLLSRLAAGLRPDQPEVAITAPWLLAITVLWMFFSTAAMFDVLLTVWALTGVLGIQLAGSGRYGKGFTLLGVAIGLGILAKGPVILLHVLPLAVLAPWWSPGHDWKRWYGGILLAVLLGAAIGLAWAIPAALHGGPEYRNAIFWGQTANRMVDSFAHRRPFWWYLPVLPLALLPWAIWPGLWQALRQVSRGGLHPGLKFCLAWALPVFIAFSLISGKQVHYMVPLLPAFALFAAQALAIRPPRPGVTQLLPGLLLLAVAAAAGWFAWHGLPAHTDWAGQVSPWTGLVSFGLLVLWMLYARRAHWLASLIGVSLLFAVTLQVGLLQPLGPAYDVTPMARAIQAAQQRGIPLAHVGNYHDQFQFAGRLEQPLQVIGRDDLAGWFAQHPDGRAIVYVSTHRAAQLVQPEFYQLYRGEVVMLVDHAAAVRLGNVQLQ